MKGGRNFLKGQYFSFDAIVAAIIFILGITLLMGNWFAIRQASDSTPMQLQEDALRVSDVLLSPGVPQNWYVYYRLPYLLGVSKAGLSQGGGQPGVFLNRSVLNAVDFSTTPSTWSNPQSYVSLKSILGVGSEVYVGAYYFDGASPKYQYFGNWQNLSSEERIGQKAQVWRIVAVNDSRGRPVPGGLFVVLYDLKK